MVLYLGQIKLLLLFSCRSVYAFDKSKPYFLTHFIIRENGTQILLDQIQNAEEIAIPRAMIDENTKYQLIITAHNHFGESQSDPFTFCVKDIGKLPFLLNKLIHFT